MCGIHIAVSQHGPYMYLMKTPTSSWLLSCYLVSDTENALPRGMLNSYDGPRSGSTRGHGGPERHGTKAMQLTKPNTSVYVCVRVCVCLCVCLSVFLS